MSTKITTMVWDHAPYHGARKLILLALADAANQEGLCWPSINTIARMAGCSPRRTQEHLTQLIEDDWVERRENPGRSNWFLIHMPEHLQRKLGLLPPESPLYNDTPCEFSQGYPRENSQGSATNDDPSATPPREFAGGGARIRRGGCENSQGGVREFAPRTVSNRKKNHKRTEESDTPAQIVHLDPSEANSGSVVTPTRHEDSPSPPPPARVVPHFAAPETPDIAAAWRRAQRDIRNRNMLTSSALATWIAPLRPLAGEWHDERFLITFHAPGSDHVRIVEQRYHGLLVTALGAALLLPSQRIQLQFESASSALLEVNA